MSRANLYGPIRLDLNDGPVRTDYGRGTDGKPTALLVIGDLTEAIAISITDASPDAIAQLESAVAELKAWTQRQNMLRGLPEVA